MARVLLADDEPAVRRSLRRVLKAKGHEVYEAPDGKEALHVLGSRSVDVLVTDIVMDTMEGLETIQRVRKEFPDVTIIAVSGAEKGTYLRFAKIFGALRVFQKPVDPNRLHEVIVEVAPENVS